MSLPFFCMQLLFGSNKTVGWRLIKIIYKDKEYFHVELNAFIVPWYFLILYWLFDKMYLRLCWGSVKKCLRIFENSQSAKKHLSRIYHLEATHNTEKHFLNPLKTPSTPWPSDTLYLSHKNHKKNQAEITNFIPGHRHFCLRYPIFL